MLDTERIEASSSCFGCWPTSQVGGNAFLSELEVQVAVTTHTVMICILPALVKQSSISSNSLLVSPQKLKSLGVMRRGSHGAVHAMQTEIGSMTLSTIVL